VEGKGEMKIVISYDNGTSELVRVRLQADIVSASLIFRPGIELVEEPRFCRWGSDFFSAAINEGNLRSGRETPYEDDEPSICGFQWEIIGTELEDCQEMMARWIGRLGDIFDPECRAEDYLYGGLLRILDEDETKFYENDQKCWVFYLADPREHAKHCFRTAGLIPAWLYSVFDPAP
jgi:hypothetical protein